MRECDGDLFARNLELLPQSPGNLVDHAEPDTKTVNRDEDNRWIVCVRDGEGPGVDPLRNASGFLAPPSEAVEPDRIARGHIHLRHTDSIRAGVLGAGQR